jgi:hypothetical protein
MNRPKALATVAATALVATLSLACKGDEAAAPRLANAADPTASPGWSTDSPQPVAGAVSPEAVAAALEILREEQRQKDLADREAELAAKEAELAEREAKVARAAAAPRPAPVRRASAPVRTSAPAPAPAPAPRRDYEEPAPRRTTTVTVPAGTSLAASVLDGASSADAQVGDSVSARVAEDVWAGGELAIPAGSILRGEVTEAQGLRRIGGRSRLAVRFDSLELRGGDDVPVYASWSAEGKGETKRDAATIAGSTVGGAVLGRVIRSRDRDRNTAIGAAAGAAVGTVIAARSRGEEVQLPAGTVVDLTLSDSVRVVVD